MLNAINDIFPHELHMKSADTIIQGLRVDLEDYDPTRGSLLIIGNITGNCNKLLQ